ncbi:flagellar biosynthesis anti-sigma factor FlgM [Sphingomonas ginkgonis]|uniref:Negative regulator of flagellin synthesis n=1 Tax=Sphingomonas ginkgonis TaxID=2315330 RepID=A0A429VCC3_9SPHN|nr:flagellar biosynthesis anti-sigma factor FlgM [Sphingomonas ginkgonis]RST31551.1 flagellar biosynthesis anti-sigma factor FlgM [Sphingomonas ginkgonis]
MVELPGTSPLRGIAGAQRVAPALTGHRPASAPADELTAKSLPQLVSLAKQVAQEGPPVDSAKIARIRDAISTGSYRADADAIAKALLGGAE